MGDRNTEGVEVARSGTKTQFSSDDHRLSILPLSTSIMSSKNVPPSAKLLSFEETNAFFSLFMLGFFFFLKNIQMGFLPYVLSAESPGPHAHQTGCLSVSHFVQFHVLLPWKKEDYFDRLKPFPCGNGRSVSFSRLPSTSRDASQIGNLWGSNFLPTLALQGLICRMRGTLVKVENGVGYKVTLSFLPASVCGFML